ncbi:tetratricopeptide repeat protein (macronuclear) [Tetrahymena thermophila SB210]|uniref:Tetratricopeptide repeat protein n=1 Tax=Tetrahymena thermophila (strain SB210) TaxID=312017 RepID=I7MJ70_TETTS|nr:tetratricopeptide repeat protein [Tetrahymena thermophila SB210]EAR96020.2 tetratricopeptide repeat protein [Tetrahymena thermophila SB210]|eukprot:XP_001016265.2 tetratricopeptide repeat protein [Tetrahymena thermophila SB210]
MMFFNADTTSVFQVFPSKQLAYTHIFHIQSNLILSISSNQGVAYQDCYGKGYSEPYDARCRPWYIYAKKNEGYFFYEPYRDAVNKNLVMTLSSQVKFGQNFQGVNSVAFDMSNLIEMFVSSQSSYSVLFHEFNNTIFYHPQLNDNSVISWQDLEFKNMTQNCVKEIDLEKCNEEKQQFSDQLTQTIQFIKFGNYSINQQKNLDQLYQYWSKFGVKKISLVFPLVSKIHKYKTQQPYSFSIILTAIVIEDYSNRFQLFNIININWIKIPLIVGFIIDETINKSYLSNLDSFKQTSKNLNMANQNCLTFQEKITRSPLLNVPYLDKVDFSWKYDSIRERPQTKLTQKHISKTIISSSRVLNQQDDSYKGSQKTIQINKKSVKRLKNKGQIQNQQMQKQINPQKSKILEELEPLFLEMKIIKETFQTLESLINYQIDAQSQNSEDIMNGLFHFAKAKGTFQKLQNQNGLIHCYYNLGVISLIQNDFQLAQEYFLSAIQFNCMHLDIDYQQLELQKQVFVYDIEQDDQLVTLKKKILCLAHSLKEPAIVEIYNQIESNLFKPLNNFKLQFKHHQQESENESLKNTLKKSIDNFRILENLIKVPNQKVSKLLELYLVYKKIG